MKARDGNIIFKKKENETISFSNPKKLFLYCNQNSSSLNLNRKIQDFLVKLTEFPASKKQTTDNLRQLKKYSQFPGYKSEASLSKN